TLLRAVPAIRERIPNVRVIVAGRGPETDKLKSLAGELALGESVQFIGGYNGEHLQRMFSAVDVYVSTSLSDAGIAASTAEAMACGVPAVISNTGENDQWVRDGENGFLFAAGDHATLAKRVVELLGDHAVRAKLGQAGRGTVIENNSYRREMGKMLKLYQDVTGLTHAPPADAAELRRS
ncbi:MAG: glycosyltransferase family 4 protein, partial [Candidatus Hydrogenedentes bacterium]|nr:glycosyltransferase family 4 protein [Candidatus Hydrogenedentota bacterium]